MKHAADAGRKTALVTGGSSGIGLALAEGLARRGYDLLLVSNDPEELLVAQRKFFVQYRMEVRTVAMDLSADGEAERLYALCQGEGLTVEVLVNDAGMFIYRDVAETDLTRIRTMLGLHVTTPTLLCRLFGADMAARGHGWIPNLSSYSAWMPWPGLALYSATKGYLKSFSEALWAELREKGVGVTVVLPAGVTTGLYGLATRYQELGRKVGVLMTPEQTAAIALKALFAGKKKCIPGVLNRLALPGLCLMPAGMVRLCRRWTKRFQK